jgi:hypothetical protein
VNTIEKRFWSKVDKRGPDECWNWTSTERGGYGRLWSVDRHVSAHRYSWELVNGPIPKVDSHHGMCVCHHCDNPGCVNPAHLFLSDMAGNCADRDAKGRANQPKGSDVTTSKLHENDIPRIKDMLL